MTHHHCGCTLLPKDADSALLSAGLPAQWLPLVLRTLGAVGPRPTAYANARAKFSAPDAGGHIRWRGRIPADRRTATVVVGGERMSVARFARNCFTDLPDLGPTVAFTRRRDLCLDEACFAPAHLQPCAPPKEPGVPTILDTLWTAANPEPLKPRVHAWDNTTRPGTPLCRAGHVLEVYPRSQGKRDAYCATCAEAWRFWDKRHKEATHRFDWGELSDIEAYVLDQWHAHPAEYDRAALPNLWLRLESWRYANPNEPYHTPEEIHALLAGTASPEEDLPAPTMAQAIDAILADFDTYQNG